MWTLSGFVDEISDDFTEQCKVASGLGLGYVEVRSAWGTNILDLDNGPTGHVARDSRGVWAEGFQHRLANRQDLHRRRVPTSSGAHATRPRGRQDTRGTVHQALLVF